ncbi:hypothetical protein [Spirillospora sp. NPDC047279]|uniref:hypothetical protein n=1 Tax=Spirillospora sp. NPDC047279 TaxID=3155478 RepID=UPI0033F216BD
MAASYRAAGDDTAARTVQLAKHRHHRATLPRWTRPWGYLQDITVGYGFRPWRAAAWLIALMTAGAALFAAHHPPPLKPGEAPQFNPVIHTLDVLLPIIDLGQEKAFNPEDWYQRLAFAPTVLGWVLATTVAAGVTRALGRQ